MENWLLKNRMDPKEKYSDVEFSDNYEDRWLSQVEIITSNVEVSCKRREFV